MDPLNNFLPSHPPRETNDDGPTPWSAWTGCLMILEHKELLNIILDFFGPDILAVTILTSTVQIYRDHEDTVRELWWCGRAATEWLHDRRLARIEREAERKERMQRRSILARELWRRNYWRDRINRDSSPSRLKGHHPTTARTPGTAHPQGISGQADRGARG